MVIGLLDDTIAAIATPPGTGGVAVIRISGNKSFETISKIFTRKIDEKKEINFEGNKIYHGWIVYNEEPVDEVLLLAFKAPKSYTGENVVEIHCHGGMNIAKKILSICLDSGARNAEPGEFTKRAFLNGKIDLSKAEAVLDIINSKTDRFSSISAHNLSGKLALVINEIRAEILDLLSIITAAIDFPEDVEGPESSFIKEKVSLIVEKIDKIINSTLNSNLMRHGVKIAIAGSPNAGKSSLFNALLNINRSIVTDIPGTTRDVIQESMDIGGIPVILTDTAGIREVNENKNADKIESIGIDLSKSYIKEADIVLLVQDITKISGQQEFLKEINNKSHIKIYSKADLLLEKSICDGIIVSSVTGEGIENLKKAIEEHIFSKNIAGDADFSINSRQKECLDKAKDALGLVLESINQNQEIDFISIDLKTALLSLGEITGEVVTDEIINNIFENFCIGK